jgi:hypothetical protein
MGDECLSLYAYSGVWISFGGPPRSHDGRDSPTISRHMIIRSSPESPIKGGELDMHLLLGEASMKMLWYVVMNVE